MSPQSIPIVDLSPYHDPSAPPCARVAAATALVTALHNLGFVALKNPGIPSPLLAEAFTWSRKLFLLPHSDKMKAPHPPTAMPHRGYSAPGVEKVYSNAEATTDGASLREIRDYKESYEIGSEHDPDQGNIWLPEDVLPGFRKFTTEFYEKCNETGNVLLRAMADGLDLNSEEREKFLELNSQKCNQLRLLHYPEVEKEKIAAKVLARMPAHTDWGICTMLWQDQVGGLELQDPKSGEWVFADPKGLEECCVLNVGDFLERVTNGHFKSASHRVTLPQSASADTLTERYSIPYFMGPLSATVGKCLEKFVTKDNPAKYDPLTFAEYATWRARFSY